MGGRLRVLGKLLGAGFIFIMPDHRFISLYIYKVYSPSLRTLCKETRNLAFLLNIFLKKACVIFKNVLPLHPLSGTKLPVSVMKEFIERFT